MSSEINQVDNVTEYERNLRKLYYIDNAKRGLQNMHELNDALGKPLDNVSHVANFAIYINNLYNLTLILFLHGLQ